MKSNIHKILKSINEASYFKWVHLSLLVLLFISCNKPKIEVINANSSSAKIYIDDKLYSGNWTMSPEYNPDIVSVEVEEGGYSKVGFYTDVDSLIYKLGYSEQKDFIVLINGKDSALTRIKAVPTPAVFTDKYIQENRGKWSIQVPEVKELLMVIFAVTPTGLADTKSMIINHDSTEYYLEVVEKFSPFKDEVIVNKMDSLIKKNWFINLKADACALIFDENNKLTKSTIYDRMRGGSNILDPYIPLLNDFAKKSDFRVFYRNHKNLYDSLIAWQDNVISTKKQWDWLENQFPDHSYDNYKITFSPLVKGNHSTVRFNNNGFKQAVMFIRPPYHVKNVNQEVSNGLITRFVFTEIDHNYVNPESDKYIKKINECFDDRNMWTNGRESIGYQTPYKIFNEYMTWSVYLLYCYDQYDKKDFEIINDRIVNYVKNRRGFHRFDDFHGTMLKLYNERTAPTTVSELYSPILDWASKYEPQ
jgi:hypothetical protein